MVGKPPNVRPCGSSYPLFYSQSPNNIVMSILLKLTCRKRKKKRIHPPVKKKIRYWWLLVAGIGVRNLYRFWGVFYFNPWLTKGPLSVFADVSSYIDQHDNDSHISFFFFFDFPKACFYKLISVVSGTKNFLSDFFAHNFFYPLLHSGGVFWFYPY